MSNLLLSNATVITPFEERSGAHVLIADDRIAEISHDIDAPESRLRSEGGEIYDLDGRRLIPGLINIHTHGAVGQDPYADSMDAWAAYLARGGVTAFLPTLVTTRLEAMYAGVANVARAVKSGTPGSRILGLNLEGPFISPRYGAQLAENCLKPDERVYGRFLELAEDNLKIMTVAPELPGSTALVRFLTDHRVIASIGHTGATAEQARRALDEGARLATHAFNAFAYPEPAFQEVRPNKVCGVRKAGALELLIACDDIYAETIADRQGLHVPAILLSLLAKCKAPDRLITVTDNLSAAGMPDGEYQTPDGRPYAIDTTKYDVVWMQEKKVIGGVLYRLKDGFMNLARHTGLGFRDALKSVTVNPAVLLGLDDRLGSIQIGKLADLAVLDERDEVCLTVVSGKVVFADGLSPNHKR